MQTHTRRPQAYVVPLARKITPKEQTAVDYYRSLRERHHEGPYYSVIDSSASSAKKGSSARVNFDPFHGMPSYSARYQKKRRTIPRIDSSNHEYRASNTFYYSICLTHCRDSTVMQFYPRELWPTIQPNFRPDAGVLDGYTPQVTGGSRKRGFEDEEDEADSEAAKRRAAGGEEGDDDPDGGEGELLEGDEDAEEELGDDNFTDDEDDMGGDYNAEQYFDGGDDEFGDDGLGDGGGGGEEDTY
ncbi:III C31 subunit of DNA-directed RNA polymerase [Penicillium capsulatum]|uniref:DNA-directed RNA polymerase III subunit n=1 Tax=Penicillium capsulatum TaxID=69766 RepID=A0A9W9IRI8_9EURO|nr:III C31 subunit of DNA-directed RNA polymerase [Penicillium capsulatum]KAJ6130631.1 III C31 subunit of DNA-directed RNA polymerase [Penicillium capsulatum]